MRVEKTKRAVTGGAWKPRILLLLLLLLFFLGDDWIRLDWIQRKKGVVVVGGGTEEEEVVVVDVVTHASTTFCFMSTLII